MNNDLISRSALLAELYEARRPPDHYSEQVYEKYRVWRNGVEFAIQKIKAAPAVDAVEVGNCKGCIWEGRKRPQKCSCCRRNPDLKDCYGERKTE